MAFSLSDLKFPEMRVELINSLQDLSDMETQRRAWGAYGAPTGTLDDAVHFLFDDTNLETEPFEHVGLIFKNTQEAKVVHALIKELNAIFDKYGTELGDLEYVGKPEWSNVIGSATIALKTCQAAH